MLDSKLLKTQALTLSLLTFSSSGSAQTTGKSWLHTVNEQLSEQIVKEERLKSNIELKNGISPAIIKMPDGNLMCIKQIGEEFTFFKTSSGYAEGGLDFNTPIVGYGEDTSEAGIFLRITALEALAYFNNEWQQIHAEVKKASVNYTKTPFVDEKLLASALEPLTVAVDRDGDGKKELTPSREIGTLKIRNLKPIDREVADGVSVSGEVFVANTPVYIKISQDELLKVVNTEHGVIFLKNAPGYAVEGARVSIAGVTLGKEITLGNAYDIISPAEALALFDHNKEKILGPVKKQAKVFKDPILPIFVEDALNL